MISIKFCPYTDHRGGNECFFSIQLVPKCSFTLKSNIQLSWYTFPLPYFVSAGKEIMRLKHPIARRIVEAPQCGRHDTARTKPNRTQKIVNDRSNLSSVVVLHVPLGKDAPSLLPVTSFTPLHQIALHQNRNNTKGEILGGTRQDHDSQRYLRYVCSHLNRPKTSR